MGTTLITSTAAVLALGGFAIAEWRAREWRKLAKAFSDQFDVQAELTNRSIDQTTRALAMLGDARAELDRHVANEKQVAIDKFRARREVEAAIDAGIARQRELRLKRSQAALKGHQKRRQG